MKKERLSLEQAAAALGKCPRQVRRFVASGQLPATGGGRGVALVFDRADVRAFKARVAYAPRRAWKGRVDAEGLARIAHALKLDPAGNSYMARGLLALWQVKRSRASAIVNSMPPVEKVPPSTIAWAQGVAEKLSPAETDFVAAMFIRRGNKSRNLRRAYGRAPTCRQVSRLLGIHHQQGTRLAESIMRKLGQAGFSELWFERLGLDDVEIARSRFWKRALRDTVQRPAASSERE